MQRHCSSCWWWYLGEGRKGAAWCWKCLQQNKLSLNTAKTHLLKVYLACVFLQLSGHFRCILSDTAVHKKRAKTISLSESFVWTLLQYQFAGKVIHRTSCCFVALLVKLNIKYRNKNILKQQISNQMCIFQVLTKSSNV